MAVSYEGHDHGGGTTNISIALTVPAATELLLVLASGKRAVVDWTDLSELSVDGDSLVPLVDTASQTTEEQTWIAYIQNPSTGSQTLSGTMDATPTSGMVFFIVYLSGIHASSPIEASDVNLSGDDVVGITGSPSADSMMLGIGADEDTMHASGNGQTEVGSYSGNNDFSAVGYEADEGDFYASGSRKSPTACACVIAAAAVVPPSAFVRPDGMLLGVY